MTPKEKAKDLYNKFFRQVPFLTLEDSPKDDCIAAKQCALIAVDEILNEYEDDYKNISKDIYTIYSWWQEVKQEIEKL